jgi:hypothetical protein
MNIAKTLVAVAAAAFATVAMAAVTYSPASGGYAPKGDVQTALGLNNNQIQQANLSFTYELKARYDYECVYTETNGSKAGELQSKDQHTNVNVDAEIDGGNRVTGQIVGYYLKPAVGDGGKTIPATGDVCKVGNDFGLIEGPVVESLKSGGLFVSNNGGTPVQLTYQ